MPSRTVPELRLARTLTEPAVALAIVSAKPAEYFRSHRRRVFPRHGDEGEGRRFASQSHRLGIIRRRSRTNSHRTAIIL